MSRQAEEPIVVHGQIDEPVGVAGAAAEESAKGRRAAPQRTMPRWESEARERVKAAIRRYNKPLADLVARDANEGDTRLLVTDFLCDGLGYDKYEDLTTEYQEDFP